MRIATTLLLGAAVLVGASVPLAAQSNGFKPLPAVAPLKSDARQAAATPVKGPIAALAKPAENPSAVPASDAPAAEATTAETPVTDKSAVQEAKNNDASLIDASADKNAGDSDSIVATVNDESISDFELRQRVALYLALNGINQQLTPEQRTRIRGQILEVLESEKVQLQEAVKKKITVSPVEVDKRLGNMMEDY